MPARIRLQRHGKKNNAFYHIVVADGRAPRDGRFIEKIGTYNPQTQPAQIVLDVDKAAQWLQNGATPSNTARRILSYKGALLRHHLQVGVLKGAITQEVADARFEQWQAEKAAKIAKAESAIAEGRREVKKSRLDAEKKANEAKAAAVAAKVQARIEAEKAKAEAEAAAAAENTEAPAAE